MSVRGTSKQSPGTGWWEMEFGESILGWWWPLVTIRGNHRGRTHWGPPPTPGSSTRTRGRFVRMGPVKVSGKWWIKNVLGINLGPFLRPVPLPVDNILQNSSPAPRVKNLLNLIWLLTVDKSRSSALLGAPAALSEETWKVGEIRYWGGKAKQ